MNPPNSMPGRPAPLSSPLFLHQSQSSTRPSSGHTSSRRTTTTTTTTTSTSTSTSKTARKRKGMAGWFSSLKSWVSTSEPSIQALKQHRQTLKKHGEPLEGARPLPEKAIRPAGRGSDPEDVARKKAEQRRTLRQSSYPGRSSRRLWTSWSTASSRQGDARSSVLS